MNDENKIIIYQVFTRLFGNNNNHCVYNGDIATNGCGKMADFTLKALGEIKKLGATHIWYTGIIACNQDGLPSLQHTSRPSRHRKR